MPKKTLEKLLQNNREWAAEVTRQDPAFFTRLAKQQSPEYLWIGCSDSRVPANQIVNLLPGEVFVHRNIANLVQNADFNCLSVIQYAVDVLKIRHIMVVGHYGCGGVRAALEDAAHGLIDYWIWNIKLTAKRHDEFLRQLDHETRLDALCELNVIEQVHSLASTKIVKAFWEAGSPLDIHGWVYGVDNGLVRDLEVCVTNPDEGDSLCAQAVEKVRQRYLG